MPPCSSHKEGLCTSFVAIPLSEDFVLLARRVSVLVPLPHNTHVPFFSLEPYAFGPNGSDPAFSR